VSISGFESCLPRPLTVEPASGSFTLDEHTTLSSDPAARGAAELWRSEVSPATGLPLPPSPHGGAGPAVRFTVDAESEQPAEGYRLRITPDGVVVTARDPAGACHAARTLRQLLGPDAYRRAPVRRADWRLPCGAVEDAPAFGWRGCMLDVARHFVPKADVLRFVDLLGAHKLNVLHLHLTDDQGWRFPVSRYPRLTEVGAWRAESTVGHPVGGRTDGTPHGGHYSRSDLAEIVAYAAARHIRVLPEIDVPGHAQAAIAAYPELGNYGAPLDVWTGWGITENILNAEESTVDFYRAVFDELLEVFPGEVVGIGGDEVPTTQWHAAPRAGERARELGLPGVDALHGWFLGRIAGHLAGHGRRALGWDEIVDAAELPPGAIVASWRGEQGGIAAAGAGHDVVMCPEHPLYFDHRQSGDEQEPVPVGYLNTLEDVYAYHPVPTGTDPERVLGAQAQVWTEHLDSPRRIDYAAYPRLSAFAEVLWGTAGDDVASFRTRLAEHHLPRLDALGVEYRPLEGPHPWQTRPGVAGLKRT
jgi:hexosaminidase